ncbi:MAG TPA: hypothetical protein DCQ98_19780 [Planctomycetaceae bacterium]|nr:hypothetical protein [Planctomycetaceae bacterium]
MACFDRGFSANLLCLASRRASRQYPVPIASVASRRRRGGGRIDVNDDVSLPVMIGPEPIPL